MSYRSSLCALLFTLCCTVLSAEICLPYCGEVGIGYDYFRSLPEGSWEGNTGGLLSVNMGTAMPRCEEYGIQVGSSYGVYDWAGRGSASSDKLNHPQQQVFFTGGIFRRTPYSSGLNMGLAYDWTWNKNAGVFAVENEYGQLRLRTGYLCNCRDEWGIWGTLDVHTAHRESEGIPVLFRAISQVNLYWEHYFDNGARTMVWAGTPYKRSLMFSTGRAGIFILGADFEAPLTNRFSIAGHASYMGAHSDEGALKHRNYAANLCLELKMAFGRDCNRQIAPYLSLGNNSNFLSDTNTNF